jgi:hypothetical protein
VALALSALADIDRDLAQLPVTLLTCSKSRPPHSYVRNQVQVNNNVSTLQ